MSTDSNISAPTLFLDVNGYSLRVSSFRSWPGPAAAVPSALRRDPRQLGPCHHGPTRCGSGSYPLRLCRCRAVGRQSRVGDDWYGATGPRFLEGLRGHQVRRSRVSLGGMVAQQVAQDNSSIFRRMILVGTAPRGGEDIMHLEKPSLARYIGDPQFSGYARLQKIFFAPTESSQKAGADFVWRLTQRKEDLEPAAGGEVMKAQIMAFRDWEHFEGDRFANLKRIRTPALVINGIHDEMIPVRNSYWLGENLPNAVLLTYPDSGHGSIFQFHESFTRHADAFLSSRSQSAVY